MPPLVKLRRYVCQVSRTKRCGDGSELSESCRAKRRLPGGALKAYKTQERKGYQAAIMYGMAAALSDQDIANLAAFYSEIK